MFHLPEEAQKLKSARYLGRTWGETLLALVLLLLLGAAGVALRYTPWLQSVHGQGTVSLYYPDQRPQEVDAPIGGRIVKTLVVEGARVTRGQKLLVLEDTDPKFLSPNQVQQMRSMISAYDQKWEAARRRLGTLEDQSQALGGVRQAGLAAARRRVEQNRQRQQQAQQTLQQARQNLRTDQLNYERLRTLSQEGLRSRRDFELAEQSQFRSKAEVEKSLMALDVAQQDIGIAQLEVSRLQSSLDSEQAKVRESYLKAQETLAEIEAERLKLRLELSNLEQRRKQREVLAPCDGQIMRLTRAGSGEIVKAGDTLFRIVPTSGQAAVELYVSDFDAPLVRQGQRVRLMFDGFPAVPFTAWPWAEVGTFGGVVQSVDGAADSGRYRVLVVPDTSRGDVPWPPAQEDPQGWSLRPGSQAQGWVMMEQPVPLYWEVWRRLIAFPPLPPAKGADKTDKASDKSSSDKPYQPKPVLKR